MNAASGLRSLSLPLSAELNASARDQLLTADQLAERWQISTAQVYRLARERQIPSLSLGRYVRFRLPSIEAFEAAQETSADA
jgi:excisionase family DNA binding protein